MSDTAILSKSDKLVYNGSIVVGADMLGNYEKVQDGIFPQTSVDYLDVVCSGRVANHPRWYSGDTPN